ncbi:MAG: PQQ-binding-like beta-propeller repeat protein [archaeon]
MNKFQKQILVFLAGFCLLLSFNSSIITVHATFDTAYDWPTFQYDKGRTGYTESPAPDSNQTFWVFSTGGAITSSPVVAAGMVFVASSDGYLYAVNVNTGTKIWDFWIGPETNSPTVAHNKVFITSSVGVVYAIDMYSGLSVWNTSLGEAAGFGAPLVVGTRVFVNGNHTVFVLNEAVGVKLYSEEMAHATAIATIAYDNSGYEDGLIVSTVSRGATIGINGFETRNGYGRFWVSLAQNVTEPVKSGVTITNEQTFLAISNGNGTSTIHEINDFGMRLWEHLLDGDTCASSAFAYNTVYIPTGNNVYALHPENGTINWSHPIDGGHCVSSPAVADEKVYFGLDNGYIYALNAYNGNIVWSYKTEGAVQSSPAISDGLLFVGSDDGNLYAIGTHTIPEFTSWTFMACLLVAVTFVLCIYKLKLPKNRK